MLPLAWRLIREINCKIPWMSKSELLMLFAFEGGGFFFSSASGYTKGVTLLLSGHKNEDRPMRVTPWNQYQLVDQDIEPDLRLDSGKNWPVRVRSSLKCFGHAGDTPPIGSRMKQEVLNGPAAGFDDLKDQDISSEDENSKMKMSRLKGSLKKAANYGVDSHGAAVKSTDNENMDEKNDDVSYKTARRKVQWTDTTGGELFDIREFQTSDDGSFNEADHSTEKTCSCRIM